MKQNITPEALVKYVFIQFYEKCNVENVLSCFSDDVSWIGPGEAEYFIGYDEIKNYFIAERGAVPHCTVSFEEMKTVKEDAHMALVMGRFIVQKDKEDMLVDVKQRCSVYMRKMQDEWKIIHFHNSNIYEDIYDGAYIPNSARHQNLEYVNRVLKEKTEVIEMINANINGGLKGSYDDENFTFFYVNDGLCKMLGYTHKEFMEMSHGTAVGAVYPPDLPSALKAVERCFAKGPTYSAEYRIRKKDGTLLWVLDSGKKMIDSDGNVKINSILIDISDMKETELQLRLERERYRMALDNLTDVMFEYDIERDYLLKYERKNNKRSNPLEKITIEHYMDYLEKGNYIHLDDIGLLKLYLLGELEQKDIEIRMYENGEWIWIHVQCSYVYNEDHKPIKSIGVWRDITKEKLRLDSLIDLSQRDALTQLYNVKTAENKIHEHIVRNDKAGLMIMDIDSFKTVNDTYGHLKGNDILLTLTSILNKNTRKHDIVFRIGGDEFAVYMYDARVEYMELLAKTIQKDAAKIHIGDGLALTLSIGIAYQIENDNYDALFKRADEAMYIAKNNGKNRIHIAGSITL